MVVGGEGAHAAAADDAAFVAGVRRGARPQPAGHVGVHRRVRARGGRPARRPARDHALGVRATTSRARIPSVTVDPDPIFVRDGNVWTSAGVTAGMDLALALVDDDLGRDVALMTARQLVLFVQRPGGQSQFSAQLGAQLAAREPIRELQQWIAEHPDDDLGVERLAARVAMSPRHFARVFRDEVGCTPAAYVERVRVEVARRLLETTDVAVDEVARAAGFGTAETTAPRVRPPGRRQPLRVPRPLPPRPGRADPQPKETAMDIALLIFDKLTALDAIGPYEVLQRLPGAQVKFVARRARPGAHRAGDARGRRRLRDGRGHERRHPARARRHRHPPARSRTSRRSSGSARSTRAATWTTSVCTGSLLLGAAGLLEGKKATTHWAVLDLLSHFGATPASERVVEQGKIITAAGVSSGIDMALHARRAHRRRRRRPGDPARHRVRPAAPVRQRLGRQGLRPSDASSPSPASPSRRRQPLNDANRREHAAYRGVLTPVRWLTR